MKTYIFAENEKRKEARKLLDQSEVKNTRTPKRRDKENQTDDCEGNNEYERKYSKTAGSIRGSVLEGVGRSEDGRPKSGSEPIVGIAI